MRLLFVTNVFPNPLQPTKGVFNLRLVQALAEEHEVRVVSPISWVDELKARLSGQGPRPADHDADWRGLTVCYPRYYYPPKVLRSSYGWFLWRSVRRQVLELLHGFRPDAVIGYWVHPDGEVAVRAARLAGVPAVVMVGGSDVLLLTKDRRRRQRILNVLRQAQAVVAVSRNLQARVIELGVPAPTVHVVYRGVCAERFFPGDREEARRRLGLPVEGRRLLWIGRMVPVKRLDVLLQACAVLRDRGTDFELSLVGDGPLRPALAAQAAALGLSQAVSFVGSVHHDDLADWYRAADLTVLPSQSEGVPNVLRESLACGTPFVASGVGGIPEIATDPTVQLVPPGDPRALAEGIARGLAAKNGAALAPTPFASWTESAHSLIRVVQSLTAPSRNGTAAGATYGSSADRGRADGQPIPRKPEPGRPSRLRQGVRRLLAATLPRRLLLVQGPADSRALCLTFDDGPDPEHTPRLLKVLKELNVPATFFVIGERAARYPDLVRRMAAEGHLIGHHSYTHSDPARTSAAQLIGEVRRSGALLADILGGPSRWFRPPHGKLTAAKLWRLCRSGQTVVLWNADPKDYACPTAADVRRWFQQRPLQGGDLVLMHDTCPHASEVVPDLVADCRARGLTFATIDQWS